MKRETKSLIGKIILVVIAFVVLVVVTALFIIAPLHQHYMKQEKQTQARQLIQMSDTLDEVNQALFRIRKLYRENYQP